MKLVVGLGNPGEKYKNTRHNVGNLIVSNLKKVKDRPKEKVRYFRNFELQELAKEPVFMNMAGEVIAPFLRKSKVDPSDLFIVHDDLDIPLGSYKLQFGKGPRQHKGVLSIEEELGTIDFWRLRVGIENRSPESKISGEAYVLQDFTFEEREVLNKLLSEEIIPEIKTWMLKK